MKHIYDGVLVDYELSKDGGLNYIKLKPPQEEWAIDEPAFDNHIMIIPDKSIFNMHIAFYKTINDKNGNFDYLEEIK